MEKKLVTVEDLSEFKSDLLKEIKKILTHVPPAMVKPWLKSHEVQRMLKISPGTLQHLRDSGAIKFSKVGGIVFYKMKDIEEMIGKGDKDF